jgi:hypothetical protein
MEIDQESNPKLLQAVGLQLLPLQKERDVERSQMLAGKVVCAFQEATNKLVGAEDLLFKTLPAKEAISPSLEAVPQAKKPKFVPALCGLKQARLGVTHPTCAHDPKCRRPCRSTVAEVTAFFDRHKPTDEGIMVHLFSALDLLAQFCMELDRPFALHFDTQARV